MPSDTEYPEGNDTVISKGPCPECGSDDNLVTYADGHAHCFTPGCNYFVKADGSTSGKAKAPSAPTISDELLNPANGETKKLESRALEAATLRKFGVFLHGFKGHKVQVYPYYTKDGDYAAQKLRLPGKEFAVLKGEPYPGKLAKCALFGWHVFGDRYDRTVVITEGELDALTVAQCTDFKIAAVSVGTGSDSAAKCLKENYLWLDRFSEIILWFDDDEPGRAATEECAKLFKVGKVRIAKVAGYKDASDILQAGKPGDVKAAIYAATAYRPRGIVNAADDERDVCAPTEEDVAFSFSWPWPELDATFGPMLPGQTVFHVAGTGVGKSTATATIAWHVIGQGGKVAYMSFEGTRREIKLALMVVRHGKRVDIDPLPDEDMVKLHRLAFGSRQMELFDPETAEWDMEALKGYVRYAAKALDCQVVVIDPLSFLVAGIKQTEDERRAIDMVSRDLSAMSKELGVHLQISHHLRRTQGIPHEEGAPTSLNELRGSGALANFATIVIGHERNQQAEGDDWMLTQLRSLKNRPRSKTGELLVLEYSLATGQLARSTRKFPAPGKAGNADEGSSQRRGFAPVGDDY